VALAIGRHVRRPPQRPLTDICRSRRAGMSARLAEEPPSIGATPVSAGSLVDWRQHEFTLAGRLRGPRTTDLFHLTDGSERLMPPSARRVSCRKAVR
jgi:hypothetical protein